MQWKTDGQAWRLRDGAPVEAISAEEARQTLERLGLEMPPEVGGA